MIRAFADALRWSVPGPLPAALVLLVALLAGCGATLQVVREAPTTALTGEPPRVAVEPVHFGITRVNNLWEDEWLATRTLEQAAYWRGDEHLLSETFARELMSATQSEIRYVPNGERTAPTLIVRPIVTELEQHGFGFTMKRNLIEISVQLVSPDGHVLDEVVMRSRPVSNLYRPTITDAMRAGGRELGLRYASYLRGRLRGMTASRVTPAATVHEDMTTVDSPVPGSPAPNEGGEPLRESSLVRQPASDPVVGVNAATGGAETILAPVEIAAPGNPTLFAPLTPVSRVARKRDSGFMLSLFGYTFTAASPFGQALAWLMVGNAFSRSPGLGGVAAEQAAWSLIPIVGSFIAAARLSGTGFESAAVADIGCGVYGAIGIVLLTAGTLVPTLRPPPLRPGASYAARWMMAPVSASGPGLTFALVW